ncbi:MULTISPECIES: filamentous haemagglutinin family protein [Methylotenera]|uniref:filamentous haemagglutinin family protein n=1 Tax=Methylotenera TaxID=359407 RepID=UPI000365FDB2|nr:MULTISPECIES: filamentous haemagglutinin family protein [Methylotenera]
MNQGIYQLVYSKVLHMFVPASEAVRSRGGKGSRRNRKQAKSAMVFTVIASFSYTYSAFAQTVLPAGLDIRTINPTQIRVTSSDANNINFQQLVPRAIVDWNSLNLGKGQNFNVDMLKSYSMLNRIHDMNPSLLDGNVNAAGNIYFINTNGIIFGANAQFNVGSLYAGTLDMTDDLFNNGFINSDATFKEVFTAVGEITTPASMVVEAGAKINTAQGGKVVLFAQDITNSGVINTPDGQTILAAGKKVYLASSKDPAGFLVEVDGGGTATNLGTIVAERGNITMMGLAVNQKGTLTATTSVRANGSIHLLAQEKVNITAGQVTGLRDGIVALATGSVTEVKPELDDKEEISRLQAFKYADDITSGSLKKSVIKMEASLINIDGKVTAKSGTVSATTLNDAATVLAAANQAKQRIYIGENANIDVSGVDAVAPMSRNQIDPELFSDQNKDNPILRDSGLNKAQVYIDLRKGTDLIDTLPFEKLKTVTLAEALTDGGTIKLSTPADIIVRKGAVLDVSGGSTTYEAGVIKETNLFYNGKLVPISEAKKGVPYDQVGDVYVDVDKRTGNAKVWALGGSDNRGWGSISKDSTPKTLKTFVVGTQVASYLEGGDAGKLDLTVTGDNAFTQNLVLAGQLIANTKVGTQQLIDHKIPNGGEILISANQLILTKVAKELEDSFKPNQMLADSENFQSVISTDFTNNGFNKINLTKVVKLEVNDTLNIKPNGALTLGLNNQINADIIAPGSNISASNISTTTVADNVRISTAGTFTNDAPGIAGQYSTEAAINGGVAENTDAGGIQLGILALGKNTVLDASAGAHVTNKRELKKGSAGNIGFISNGKIDDSVTLQAYGFDHGGKLAVNFDQQQVNIAGNANASATDIDIARGFFNKGGFSEYKLSGLTVNIGDTSNNSPAQEIYTAAQTWQINPNFANEVGGQAMSTVASTVVLPEDTRQAVSLNFSADKLGGVLTLAENTTLRTDRGGNVSLSAGKQVNVLGDITTPSGNIDIHINDDDVTLPQDATQAVFIGEKSVLSARGTTLTLPDSQANLLHTQVFNAGTIKINQAAKESEIQKGALIIKKGAVLDVSGASIVNDVNTVRGLERATLHGDAGTISLTGIGSMLLDGDFKGAATGSGRDGSLNLTFAAQEFSPETHPESLYPNGSGTFTVTQQKQLQADNFNSGDAIKTVLTDSNAPINNSDTAYLKAQVSAQQIAAGDFANVKIKSYRGTATPASAIELADGVDLKVAGNLTLESPVVKVKDDGIAKLTANHITFKSLNTVVDAAAVTAGTGQLTTQASQTYIDGAIAIVGVNKTIINNVLDVHGQGALAANGDINITARQIYPNTAYLDDTIPDALSFEAMGDGSKITINSSGQKAKPVLSAAGTLKFKADNIVQNGVLTAPFGSIQLEGKESVTLVAGSKTSISADSLTIPYLQTQTGGKDTVPLDVTLSEKRIEIQSKSVDLQKDAVLDLSATGSLFSYEFIKGIGGSNDVLAQPNTYAVIPNFGDGFAPVDIAYNNAAQAVGVGKTVYLTGVPGLASGMYTLLPARYALVPGAFMVQANAGNLLAGAVTPQLDGSHLATGYFSELGTGARDANWSTFKVTDGAIFRPAAGTISKSPSQYLLTDLTDFYSNPLNTDGKTVALPIDAGKLSLDAEKLNLDATIVANKGVSKDGKSGSGLQVDIASDQIRVVSNKDAADTTSLQLTADSLNKLNAESLVLGGTSRLDSAGVKQITTKAETVSIENSSADAIKTPTFIATASDIVTVKSGAVIDTGPATKTPTKTVVASNGEGALFAASSASDISYSRAGGANATKGVLDIQADSTIKAGNSVVLDATQIAHLDGNVTLQDGGSATLGANRILLGNAPIGTAGLNVNAASLAALGQLKSLALNSYSNVDTFGAVNFGNRNLNLTIDAAGIAGNLVAGETAGSVLANNQPVVFIANQFTLKNTSGATLTDPLEASNRTLNIQANTVKLEGKQASNTNTEAGKTQIAGYTNVAINADEVRVANAGETNFNVANTTVTTGRISAETAADYKINATQLSVNKLENAKITEKAGFGAKLGIAADNLTVASNIDLASGQLSLTAKTGDLTIENGANISATSNTVNFYNTAVQSNAGSVTLASTTGNVNVKAGAVVDVTSQGVADAGLVKVIATSGTANIAGQLKGAAAGTGKGGRLAVDVKTLSNLNTTDNQAAGFDEKRQYRVREGDVNIAATGVNALKSRDIEVSADAGKITVSGDIIATAPKNSRIALFAGNGVTLESTANLKANSTKAGEAGGEVQISSTAANLDNTPDLLDFKTGSKVDVSGGVGGLGGDVTITAPRTLDNKDIEIAQMGTTFTGVNGVVKLVGEKVYVKTGTNASLNAADFSKSTTTGFYKETESFMKSVYSDVAHGLSRLNLAGNAQFNITPEVEVVNKNGSLTLASDTSLYDWRFDAKTGAGVTDTADLQKGFNANGELLAGTLSLRASQNITVNGTLSDGFSNATLTVVSTPARAATPEIPEVLDADGNLVTPAIPAMEAQDAVGVQGLQSWTYNLVAGADFSAANQLTTNDNLAGNITVANNKGIRTGTGDINIAAAGNLTMAGIGSVVYTAGRNAAGLAGFDSPASSLAPLYLTDGGDIHIATKGNIVGGESATSNRQLINNWLFRQGGGRDSRDTTWWVRPDLFKQSTATLGGGDIYIDAVGNISNFSASAPTTARFDSNGTSNNQVVSGGGDVTVNAGNDIVNGVYYVAKGDGVLNAGNDIRNTANTFGTMLALQDGNFKVNAGNNAYIESVVNPTLLAQSTRNDNTNANLGISTYFNSYSDAAKVNVAGLLGNVVFGQTPVNDIGTKLADFKTNAVLREGVRYYPSQVNAIAFNGDIRFGENQDKKAIVLLPSAMGDLKLLAANNIQTYGILMSDADISGIASINNPLNQTNYIEFENVLKSHAAALPYQNAIDPVLIVANNGNITGSDIDVSINLPKFAKIVAGNDIDGIKLNIQHNNNSDISLVKAGNDVKTQEITVSGPGELLVQASRNIDLVSTLPTTITAIGNTENAALPENGASITLQAGLGDGAKVQAYIDQYILPTGAGPSVLKDNVGELAAYHSTTSTALTDYMRKTQKPTDTPYTDAMALAAFNQSGLESKTIFVNRHLSSELVASALGFAKAGNHDRGDTAIAALFPTKNVGDILLFNSKVSTNSGGSIDMLAPGGAIIVGAPGVSSSSIAGQDIGVITEKSGPIRMLADQNIEVNQSKVITQFGSDIVMWSNKGTIDAGKGAKSATSTPQRIVQTDAFGNTTVEVRGTATGSGIRAQSYDPDGPNGIQEEPKKGDVYLVAPIVDAGEAGIEAGDLVIVAPIVLNSTNIQVQGASSGVPIAATSNLAGVNAGLSPDSVNSATAAVAQSVAQSANQSMLKPVLPSIISVDVISIGQ